MDDDQAISRLPHLCREAVLRHRAGLPLAAIARQLSIEPASARSLIELAEAKIIRLRSVSPHGDIE
jgi:DNA-directed RNA polymerase specialized sigma24 family protein